LNGRSWVETAELRIGLGCMRLPADDDVATETIAAAATAGITIFDTAHAYGSDDAASGQNERLLAQALRACGADRRARIVTKGGMTRIGGAWVPDGRGKSIHADCEASLEALGGLAIDLYLIHAPDPRTPWSTSVRALARLLDEGIVSHVGLSNVNRRQLEEAVDLVDVTAIEVSLSALDDAAVRGGLLGFCTERGIAVIAHSSLGGPRRARALARRPELMEIARARDATPQEVALAWVLDLSQLMIAIPGARRPETARSAAHAASIVLTQRERSALGAAFGWPQPEPAKSSAPAKGTAEVVVVMGVPGAGKSRHAEEYVTRGYVRLNRDERGGSLREISVALDAALASGERRIVLDNTYLTRAARSRIIENAARHGAVVSCTWIDTPLAQAQVNMVERLLDRFGSLPGPDQIRDMARREPGLLSPTRQMRAFRELEPPSPDEGFLAVQRQAFERSPRASAKTANAAAVFVAAGALSRPGWEAAVSTITTDSVHLLFDWRPGASTDVLDADAARLAAVICGPVIAAICPHPGGAPVCWCRPPLPGLILEFARTNGIDLTRSVLVGTGPAHRALATTIGSYYRAGRQRTALN
jgi:aryl-alcohol dehydrogenase-like predicted oxidoreductase